MIRTQIGVRSLTDSSSHKEHHPFAVEAASSGFEIKRLTEVLRNFYGNDTDPFYIIFYKNYFLPTDTVF